MNARTHDRFDFKEYATIEIQQILRVESINTRNNNAQKFLAPEILLMLIIWLIFQHNRLSVALENNSLRSPRKATIRHAIQRDSTASIRCFFAHRNSKTWAFVPIGMDSVNWNPTLLLPVCIFCFVCSAQHRVRHTRNDRLNRWIEKRKPRYKQR